MKSPSPYVVSVSGSYFRLFSLSQIIIYVSRRSETDISLVNMMYEGAGAAGPAKGRFGKGVARELLEKTG